MRRLLMMLLGRRTVRRLNVKDIVHNPILLRGIREKKISLGAKGVLSENPAEHAGSLLGKSEARLFRSQAARQRR
ncbi:hypothetical protein EXN66_Car015221 [Channa argus]|uniref:Uncharacterized protein n=1 Tax=Channa argus TaxID=215402 RepID=A0A6G1QAT8_CHAAH|nr:hypothetical protein EXN66_Car015221 [Channa argus]